MSDPYADAFARDYMASKDFARMYGVEQPTKLRFFQFGVKEAKDPTNYRAPAKPKPVVWFVEHQDLPMFVNNTQHEYLLDRFGFEYWTNENRQLILHAPVMLKCWTKNAGDGTMHIVEMSGNPRISQWAPIGADAAAKMVEYRGDLDFERDRWRYWLSQYYPELMGHFDAAGSLAELATAFKVPYMEYIKELRGDMGQQDRAREREQQTQHADPSPEPNFDPPKEGKIEIGVDDIPF